MPTYTKQGSNRWMPKMTPKTRVGGMETRKTGKRGRKR